MGGRGRPVWKNRKIFPLPAKELDEETGYYYFGARYYDPKVSVWISTDPAIGKYLPTADQLFYPEDKFDFRSMPGIGGVYASVNLNVYHYAGQNPIKLTDPDGNVQFSPIPDDVKEKYISDTVNNFSRGYSQVNEMAMPDYIAGRGKSILKAAFSKSFWKGVGSGLKNAWGAAKSLYKAKSLINQSFGKLGTVIANEAGKITGFTKHGMHNIINRGVNPKALLETVKNPKVLLQQSGGKRLYLSNEAAVVLDKQGKVITAYSRKFFDKTVKDILKAVDQ